MNAVVQRHSEAVKISSFERGGICFRERNRLIFRQVNVVPDFERLEKGAISGTVNLQMVNLPGSQNCRFKPHVSTQKLGSKLRLAAVARRVGSKRGGNVEGIIFDFAEGNRGFAGRRVAVSFQGDSHPCRPDSSRRGDADIAVERRVGSAK